MAEVGGMGVTADSCGQRYFETRMFRLTPGTGCDEGQLPSRPSRFCRTIPVAGNASCRQARSSGCNQQPICCPCNAAYSVSDIVKLESHTYPRNMLPK